MIKGLKEKSSDIHLFRYSFNHDVVKVALSCLFLVVLALFSGFQTGAFAGFPKGYDAYGHLSLIKIIRDNFPQVFWNPYWDSGTMLFPRAYPPLYHFSLGIVSRFLPIDLPFLMVLVSAGSFVVIVLSLFATVYELTKKIFPSLFAGLFFLASSGVWAAVVEGGLHPRVFSFALLAVSLLGIVRYLRGVKGKGYALMVLAMAGSLSSHFLAGLLSFLSFFLLLVVLIKNPAQRVRLWLKTSLSVLGLSFFWLAPMVLLLPKNVSLIGSFSSDPAFQPLSLGWLLSQRYPSLPFFALPLFGFFLFFSFLAWTKKERSVLTVAWVFAVLFSFCLVYSLGVLGLYFSGVYPSHLLFPASIFLGIFLGLGFSLTASFEKKSGYLNLIVIIGLFSFLLSQAKILKIKEVDYSRQFGGRLVEASEEEKERRFRFANSDQVMAGMFNFQTSWLQTRDYYGQGVLYPHFQYWLEKAVFDQDNNLEETRFLLDWYAVKNFYLRKPFSKLKSGEDFTLARGFQYVYKQAVPILTATDALPVLFFGQMSGYEDFLYLLALGNLRSQALIPVRSSVLLENITAEEIKRFPALVIYGEKISNFRKVATVLKRYLEGGGRVYWETNEPVLERLEDPFPLTSVKREERTNWDFEAGGWGPPAYGAEPWGVGVGEGVKNWAKVLMKSAGKPVLVAGEYGKGKIVWSGLNLPYHIKTYKSKTEVEFWKELVGLGEGGFGEDEEDGGRFVNAQRREIVLEGKYKGVLLKESYFKNWQAWLEEKRLASSVERRALRIYFAGPGMMYVPLVKDSPLPIKVIFEYRAGWVEKISFLISLATLIYLTKKTIKQLNE